MDQLYADRGITGGRAKMKVLREAADQAIALISLPDDDPRREPLNSDLLLRFVTLDAVADVLCPAAKLWNTGWGAQMMRELIGTPIQLRVCQPFIFTDYRDRSGRSRVAGEPGVKDW